MAREMLHLIRHHDLYVISPLLLTLVLLAFLAFSFAPAVTITFIFAGP